MLAATITHMHELVSKGWVHGWLSGWVGHGGVAASLPIPHPTSRRRRHLHLARPFNYIVRSVCFPCLPPPTAQALFARFEWVPWQRPHMMSPKDILAAQHACRKLLNVSAAAGAVRWCSEVVWCGVAWRSVAW